MSGRRFDNSRGRRGRGGGKRETFPQPAHNQDNVPVLDWEAKRAEWDALKKAKFKGLGAVIKNFYKEHRDVAKMTKEEVDQCRRENREISVSTKDGSPCLDAPNPVRTFREAWHGFPDLLELLEGRYEKPSPIQMQLWPVLLSGRDAVGIAQTGTGKTLAFLLPGLVNIMNQAPDGEEFVGPRLLVLAPTRELAQQIHEEVNKLNYSKVKSVCVYGKGDRQKQLSALEDGAQVVVATPGRLDDLLRAKEVDLKRVSYVVFDEADRMLDMGFMHHLTFIISGVREDRQFIMTSATWCQDIHYIGEQYLKNEILVRVGQRELETVYTVSQQVRVCEKEEKFNMLMEYLKSCDSSKDKGIVFVNRRTSCDPLMDAICSHYNFKFPPEMMFPDTLYGSMDQEAREQALESFREGRVRLLICTDVAARGLDVTDVTFVINYDLPGNLEEYVHRSGRTGRAGRTGVVQTFVCWEDRRNVRRFIEILDRSKTEIPPELRRLADRADRFNEKRNAAGGGGGGRGGGGFGGRDRRDNNGSSYASSYNKTENRSSYSSCDNSSSYSKRSESSRGWDRSGDDNSRHISSYQTKLPTCSPNEVPEEWDEGLQVASVSNDIVDGKTHSKYTVSKTDYISSENPCKNTGTPGTYSAVEEQSYSSPMAAVQNPTQKCYEKAIVVTSDQYYAPKTHDTTANAAVSDTPLYYDSGIAQHTDNTQQYYDAGTAQYTDNTQQYYDSGTGQHTDNTQQYYESGTAQHTDNTQQYYASGTVQYTDDTQQYYDSGTAQYTDNTQQYYDSSSVQYTDSTQYYAGNEEQYYGSEPVVDYWEVGNASESCSNQASTSDSITGIAEQFASASICSKKAPSGKLIGL